MTSTEQLARRFVETINERDFDALDALLSPDLVAPPLVVDAPAESFRTGLEMAVASFPDVRLDLDDLLVAGDRAALLLRISATNIGPYRRGAATGQRASWPAVFVLRFAGGQLTELGGVSDRFGCLQQFGLIGSDDEIAAAAPDDPNAGRYLVVDSVALDAAADPDRALELLRHRRTGPAGARVYTARHVDDPRRLIRYAHLAGSREQVSARVAAAGPAATGTSIATYRVVAIDDLP
ncbi:nuclear transport factor 2 family protein [Actinocatenispora sera]|uniref:ester cyclase n=1 Tax=Actinocatenispora sera TaxID=390989 RepID=UPI0033DE3DA1